MWFVAIEWFFSVFPIGMRIVYRNTLFSIGIASFTIHIRTVVNKFESFCIPNPKYMEWMECHFVQNLWPWFQCRDITIENTTIRFMKLCFWQFYEEKKWTLFSEQYNDSSYTWIRLYFQHFYAGPILYIHFFCSVSVLCMLRNTVYMHITEI